MTKSKNDRKTVEIDRKKIPLRSLLHGKEIRDAAQSLETFRMKLNEQEFLYGAKLYVDWKNYDECYIVARRPETDKEYEDRLERSRVSAEQKAERSRKYLEREAQRRIKRIAQRKAEAAEHIRQLALEAGIRVDILGN